MLKKVMIIILLMGTFAFSRWPLEVITMSRCDPESTDVIVTFIDSYIGMFTIIDTCSCLVYIKGMEVYYLTKRDSASVRFDGEIFKYVEHKCIKRKPD